MKAGPFVASGIAHLGVVWALLATDEEPTRASEDAALIQFEPVSAAEPDPDPAPDPQPETDPEPEPDPDPDLSPDPKPSEPRRGVRTKPTTPVDPTPGSAEQAGPGPRRLDLTLSNADAGGSPSGGGDGQGHSAGTASADAKTTNQPTCNTPATKPKPIERVPIEYPAKAQAMGLEGRLVLQALVEANGAVASVKVIESVGSAIDEPARAAMRQWRFEPATRCGEPVAARYVIAREFRLGD